MERAGFEAALSPLHFRKQGFRTQAFFLKQIMFYDTLPFILDFTLSELTNGRGCFVIVRKFSMAISADMIIVMDDGRIAAQGRGDELVRSCPPIRASGTV